MTEAAVEAAQIEAGPAIATQAPTATFVSRVLSLTRQSPSFAIGLVLVLLSIAMALFGGLVAPFNPTQSTPAVLLAPSGRHWFGTDAAGVDILSRVVTSARIDVTVALFATIISVIIGSLIGLAASFRGGRIGGAVLRSSDLLQAFPLFVLAIIYVDAVGRSATNIVVVVAVLNIPIYIRLMRTQVVVLRNRTFVEAARANGNREIAIAFRQVLPNALTPAWAQASVTLGGAIIVTAGLSFIGAGVPPPTPEWGSMIAFGADGIVTGQWWPSVFPGIAMSLCVFGFASVGEGLRRVVSE